MPSKKLSSAQQRKLKANLRKLKDLGLYTGDLRKKPGRAANNALSKFENVLSGKAAVITPKNPKRFKGIYTVKGDAVIVPRRKGERVRVDKAGNIVTTRKSGKRTVVSNGVTVKRGEKIPKPKDGERVQYAIPFNMRGGETHWMRFPDYDELQKFMAGYNYQGWQDYVVVERIGEEFDDEELSERLDNKRKGRRIKGGLPRTIKTPKRTVKRRRGKR